MKKFLFKILILFLSAPVLLIGALLMDSSAITFESLESKGPLNEAEYNEIRLIASAKKDVWVMRQSQGLPTSDKSKWDRLAIVVNKQQKPFRASFYQLKSGSWEWNEPDAKAYRVSCFMCHANGPRAIREVKHSKLFPVSLWQQLRLKLWNIRMARYGRVIGQASVSENLGNVPFRLLAARDNESLKVGACVMCHNNNNGGRGFLTRQNVLTAQFLTIEQRLMPPGFEHISKHHAKQLRRFINGF